MKKEMTNMKTKMNHEVILPDGRFVYLTGDQSKLTLVASKPLNRNDWKEVLKRFTEIKGDE